MAQVPLHFSIAARPSILNYPTESNGTGWSMGNCIGPFACLYGARSLENADSRGIKSVMFNAAFCHRA